MPIWGLFLCLSFLFTLVKRKENDTERIVQIKTCKVYKIRQCYGKTENEKQLFHKTSYRKQTEFKWSSLKNGWTMILQRIIDYLWGSCCIIIWGKVILSSIYLSFFLMLVLFMLLLTCNFVTRNHHPSKQP